jgi:CRP-like cAMP-binding protein
VHAPPGLCDAQVSVECGLYKFETDIVRSTVDPEFHTTYHFPKPLDASGSPDSQHLIITLLHADSTETLERIARQCELVVAEPGATIMHADEAPERMLMLASGSVSVSRYVHAPRFRSPSLSPTERGRAGSPKGGARASSPNCGSFGRRSAKTRVKIKTEGPVERVEEEVGTISTRGACFGDLAVLMGQSVKYSLTAAAEEEVLMVQVPRGAIAWLMEQQGYLAEAFAHFVCLHRENAAWARRGASVDVHVHVHGMNSVPDFINLGYGQCDPTVYLQVAGQRASTNTMRYQRQAGAKPHWNQFFSFHNVPFNANSPAGARGNVNTLLQLVVCEVDVLGHLDYVLGKGNLALTKLLRSRRLVTDVPMSGQSFLQTSIGQNASPNQITVEDGNIQRGMDIYEDEEDSGVESHVCSPAPWRDSSTASGRTESINGVEARKGSAETANMPGSRNLGSDGAKDAGSVSVDVRVDGCFYPGEQDFLQALRSVGLEDSFVSLRNGGIQV